MNFAYSRCVRLRPRSSQPTGVPAASWRRAVANGTAASFFKLLAKKTAEEDKKKLTAALAKQLAAEHEACVLGRITCKRPTRARIAATIEADANAPVEGGEVWRT